jgi:hypothetical protein
VVCNCGNSYPRAGFVDAPLTALTAYAEAAGKKLVFGGDSRVPNPVRVRGYYAVIADFTPEDYAQLCAAYLPSVASQRLDYAKIHRFAPKLNAP